MRLEQEVRALMYKIKDWILIKDASLLRHSETNEEKRIGSHDFLVLLALCSEAGMVVSKETILEKAWPGKIVSDSSITQAISNIRTLIGDNGKEQKWLKTIAKVGYKLESEIVKDISKEDTCEDKNNDSAAIASPIKASSSQINIEPLHIAKKKWPYFSGSLIFMISFYLIGDAPYLPYIREVKPSKSITPEQVYSDSILKIYSDNDEFTDSISDSINNVLISTSNKKRPKSIYLMLKKDSLSIVIIDSNKLPHNMIILLENNESISEIEKLTIKEVGRFVS
ncbi:winged helix-turn-helix domain-containing protein [Photobacterium alginatilyticum]|nr:winged helix-turn-helix domain-containing protein [Photobacterium alginatilyticum]